MTIGAASLRRGEPGARRSGLRGSFPIREGAMNQMKTLAIRIAEDQIRADVSRGNRDGHPSSDYPMDDWTVVLRWEGRSLPISWWTGFGLTGTPTARDVLARLLSD